METIFRMLDGKEVVIEEDFKVEVMNPRPLELEIALFNARHPEQHTSLEYLTKEQIKERYGQEIS
jgi:hypothetical protein